MGMQALAWARHADLRIAKPEIVTGHDFRGYSASVKNSDLRVDGGGLQSRHWAGGDADGIFRAVRSDVSCVAMVTASHNDNGWTGVKMGANRPLTFGPDEMTRLKDIVLNAKCKLESGIPLR